MATQQYDATDANGQTVQLTNSDDPAEGGGATLQDIVSALQSAQDVSGATVTVTDDGAFNITLDAQNAGLAQDSTIADQESYDSLVVDPATDTQFTEVYNAIKVAEGAVDGTLEIVDGTGSTVTIPQAHLTGGQILPVTVQEVKSASSQTLSNVMLLRN
jgi:citrate lyase gamma subunit